MGSNIEPRKNLPLALAALSEQLPILAVSKVYETAPVGAPGTPVFLNAAILALTGMNARDLQARLLRPLEARMGRVRRSGYKSAPREIDLDVLLYGDEVIRDESGEVVIPRPETAHQAYAALPLADLDSAMLHPTLQRTLGEIAHDFGDAEGVRLSDLVLG
jgi:2-amino-4-hydroxy-6-hydroxymethyldihydropteridine diphosphokinase